LLTTIPFLLNSDGFLFDTEIIAQAVAFGFGVGEIGVPTRYFKEASSVNFRKSVIYGFGTLWTMLKYAFDGLGIVKLSQFHRSLQQVMSRYHWAELAANGDVV
jgi:hypothetical protein